MSLADKVRSRLESEERRHAADLKARVLKATKKGPPGGGEWDLLALARTTDAKIADLEAAVATLKAEGFDVEIREGHVRRDHDARGGRITHIARLDAGGWVRFGIIGDNQLGNRHSRLDVLNTAYDHYKREGLDTVYHTGNMIDGYHDRFNAFELVLEAGTSLESQSAYAAAVYPKIPGINTKFITGECHEGWWAKRIGVNVGRVMEDRFRAAGRNDLQYIGHLEADVEIRHPKLGKGTRGPMVRLVHPGGGTAYALSYKTQKMAEAYQGGEKPQAQFVGHFHKFEWNYHREVHNVQTGCTCDQTGFMRKMPTAAHVGYLIGEMLVGSDGTISRFRVEWCPFYDKGFYQKFQKW